MRSSQKERIILLISSLFCLSQIWRDTWSKQRLKYFKHKEFRFYRKQLWNRQLPQLEESCFKNCHAAPCLQWGVFHPSSHLIERQGSIVRTVQGVSIVDGVGQSLSIQMSEGPTRKNWWQMWPQQWTWDDGVDVAKSWEGKWKCQEWI